MSNRKSYKLKVKRFEHVAGTVVYECAMHSYGLIGEDERETGIEHKFVTLNEDGDYPAFTIPRYQLEVL